MSKRRSDRCNRALETCDDSQSHRLGEPRDSGRGDPNTTGDVQLMQRVAKGDPAALAALFDRHAGKLLNLCRRVTRHDDLADDAVLETFWELWNRPDRYDAGRATPLTYLFILARCRALDLVRREAAIHDRQQRDDINGSTAPAVRDTAANEFDIDGALDQVSPKCRDALYLCVVNGLTAQQAARSLGIPLGTMKSRVRKGVIQLRALLRTH